MANAVYPLYKQAILTDGAGNGLNLSGTSGPYVALCAGYTYSATHQFYSSLTGIAGTDQALSPGNTVTNGTFVGPNVTFTAVATGPAITSIVVYRHTTGANTTWPLVLFEDTNVTGLPVTPNGGNIVITWNAAGIFTISDGRVKESLKPTGELLLGALPVYEFNYRGCKRRHVGVIAQEAEKVVPESVFTTVAGVKVVDYDRLLERLGMRQAHVRR